MQPFGIAACLALLAGVAAAQTPAEPPQSPSTTIGENEAAPALVVVPAPGGAVYLPTAKDRAVLYDTYHYAPVRRAGDFVFVAGVIAGPLPGEGRDVEALRKQIRRAFQTIARNLAAAGAKPADIVEADAYFVVGSKGFNGDLSTALTAFDAVNDVIKPPYPTWNLIGVAQLFEPDAVFEFKVTAYAPLKRK